MDTQTIIVIIVAVASLLFIFLLFYLLIRTYKNSNEYTNQFPELDNLQKSGTNPANQTSAASEQTPYAMPKQDDPTAEASPSSAQPSVNFNDYCYRCGAPVGDYYPYCSSCVACNEPDMSRREFYKENASKSTKVNVNVFIGILIVSCVAALFGIVFYDEVLLRVLYCFDMIFFAFTAFLVAYYRSWIPALIVTIVASISFILSGGDGGSLALIDSIIATVCLRRLEKEYQFYRHYKAINPANRYYWSRR